MQLTFLNYFLVSIVSFLGLIIGYILIKIAPEEQKPGKRYFTIFKKFLFIFIISLPLIFYKINLIITLGIILFMIILIVIHKIRLEKVMLIYFLLGIIFPLSSAMLNLFLMESTLIFLFGMTTSSIIANTKKKSLIELKRILVSNSVFFLSVIVLYFLI